MKKVTVKEFKILLAQRIKQLRTKSNLTQAELAIKIGYKDKQVINNYEINGANPTAYNLVLLAKALDVTINELVDFSKLTGK
ncbi:helix-turn-helix domain-containing protein [Pedobacter montanisoli]|uniref:Helix-turn-helix domain-containing protein n=1 Tax=Pedobacter montanisoli TaxID=2923277 RepID=A0ABS9ZZB8_9SPHI|nr:helix-turn-helix transcriptional regulator [Pedobacter montanisoli]MCJ0743629.1 helix-turn-helix domain-containing protein [Pedobacter montanisoli]